MPTYDFHCPACAATFEEKRSFARADEPAVCPQCGDTHAAKTISSVQFFSPGSAAKALLERAAVNSKILRAGPDAPEEFFYVLNEPENSELFLLLSQLGLQEINRQYEMLIGLN